MTQTAVANLVVVEVAVMINGEVVAKALGLTHSQFKQVLHIQRGGQSPVWGRSAPTLKHLTRLDHLTRIVEQIPDRVRPFMTSHVTVAHDGGVSLFDLLKADHIDYILIAGVIGHIINVVDEGIDKNKRLKRECNTAMTLRENMERFTRDV